MCEAILDLFKDEIAAKIAAAEALVREETIKETEARVRSETEARVKETEARMKALEAENAELRRKLVN